MTIGQHLSEIEIVVRPDGRIGHRACFSISNYPHAFVVSLGNCTSGIDEVTVGITVFHIAIVASLLGICWIEGIRIGIVARQRILRQVAVGLLLQVLILRSAGKSSVVVVALVQVEAVQVVGHRTIVELRLRHWSSQATTVIRRVVALGNRIVAVDNLCTTGSCRIAEDGFCTSGKTTGRAGVNPAVLYIAVAAIDDTGRRERTRHAKVIDVATELAEQ